MIPTSGTPVLILSLPRSGSSWLGEALGYSRRALYLREPMTQTYLQTSEQVESVFQIVPDQGGSVPFSYESSAAHAFRGVPTFPRDLVPLPLQWRLSRRTRRTLVIKEVNPLALEWFSRRFDFKLIYLVRHPGAVAASWHRLGWGGTAFDKILGPDLLRLVRKEHELLFWTWNGALQALTHKVVYSQLSMWDTDRFRIVTYEDLCSAPGETIRDLFTFAGLPWSGQELQRVQSLSEQQTERAADPYGTKRYSRDMPDRWRSRIATSDLHLLREAYLYYEPPVYADAW